MSLKPWALRQHKRMFSTLNDGVFFLFLFIHSNNWAHILWVLMYFFLVYCICLYFSIRLDTPKQWMARAIFMSWVCVFVYIYTHDEMKKKTQFLWLRDASTRMKTSRTFCKRVREAGEWFLVSEWHEIWAPQKLRAQRESKCEWICANWNSNHCNGIRAYQYTIYKVYSWTSSSTEKSSGWKFKRHRKFVTTQMLHLDKRLIARM